MKKPASLQIKINTLFAMEIITQVTVGNSYFLKSVMMIEKTRKKLQTMNSLDQHLQNFQMAQILDEKPLRVQLISF